MKTLQERINLLMDETGLTVRQIHQITGVSSSAVSQWKEGPTKSIKPGPAEKLARHTGFNALWLATGEGPARTSMAQASNIIPARFGERRIPVISSIQAGNWRETVDRFQPGDADEWLYTDARLTAGAFALEIVGNSMEPEFREGDRVIIDPGVAPRPGSFVAAVNGQSADGERKATFKKYRPRHIDAAGNAVFELVPLNDDYPTLQSDVQQIEIIGTMVEHRRYFR